MDPRTREALAAINRVFYDAEAEDFSASRSHFWPGWKRLVRRLGGEAPLRVLDVGCGNGRFALFLASELKRPIQYTGVDASAPLLEMARQAVPDSSLVAHDLVLDAPAALPTGPFELITLFGVTHHIPGEAARRELLQALAARLAPKGLLAVTIWQFARINRFESRIAPWEESDVDPDQLEPGDHLLRWGTRPGPLRYCHDTNLAELERLTAALPLERVDEYAADGRSNDLNLYLIFARGD